MHEQLAITRAGGRAYLFRVIPVVVKRQAALWMRFRVSSALDLLSMAAQASIFFFVGQAVGGEAAWSAGYAGFLAVGLVMNTLLQASLSGPYQSIAGTYWDARLESFLLSPCPIRVVIFADVAWSYAWSVVNAVVLGVIGYWFGARLAASPAEIAGAVLVAILASVAVLGFGYMSAAMFMLINAKGFNDPIAWSVGLLQGLVAGAYFSVSELPGPLHAVALLLPQTYAIDAVRRLLNVTADAPLVTLGTLSAVQSDILILTAAAIILLALGIGAFSLGMAKAQRDGGLSRWV
jgi:ABC-2 type transport system permease protein